VRSPAALLLLFATLSACAQPTEQFADGGKCPALSDMAIKTPPCAAAKGLAGDSLICIDFSSVADQALTKPSPSELAGWDFEAPRINCWQILNGRLQVQNFPTFMDSCGFRLPEVNLADYQKYNSFTLSVVQTVDLNAQKQTSWIYLGLDLAAQQIVTNTGINPRQRNIYEVAKSVLPNGGNNSYQPLFKISSTFAGGAAYQGWQIESIAVIGTP